MGKACPCWPQTLRRKNRARALQLPGSGESLHEIIPFLVELVKAKIAAPALTEFESPLDASGVAPDTLVVSRVGEMLEDTLGEWRNVRAECVVNPFAFLGVWTRPASRRSVR